MLECKFFTISFFDVSVPSYLEESQGVISNKNPEPSLQAVPWSRPCLRNSSAKEPENTRSCYVMYVVQSAALASQHIPVPCILDRTRELIL